MGWLVSWLWSIKRFSLIHINITIYIYNIHPIFLGMIKDLEKKHLLEESGETPRYGTSLSVPRPTNAAGMPIDQ